MTTVLEAIHIHPVKSCRAVAVDEARVVATGLEHDRQFQVVDRDGNPLTQRQHPSLATVQPTLTDGGLRLYADGVDAIEFARPRVNDTEANSLLGIPVQAADAGDEAATWFGDLLGVACRLVALTDDSEVFIPGFDIHTSWADAAPVLVASSTSLDWLVERGDEPFGMDRFRPNLTIGGAEPWDEDTWRRFTVGDAELGLGLAWPRCAIPQIDQRSGAHHHEPARVLKSHRWCAAGSVEDEAVAPLVEGNALFGIACDIGPAGATIAVGDPVTVLEQGAPILSAPR